MTYKTINNSHQPTTTSLLSKKKLSNKNSFIKKQNKEGYLNLPFNKTYQKKYSNKYRNSLNTIFIGNLSLQTTEQTLYSYFSTFGHLTQINLVKDPTTKQSKGFAFIQYSNASMLDVVFNNRPHLIDNQTLKINRHDDSTKKYRQTNKVFISGILDPHRINELVLQKFFKQLGNVVDITVPRDKNYAFILFDDYDTVDKLTSTKRFLVNGIQLTVKKALDPTNEQAYLNILCNEVDYRKHPNSSMNRIYGSYNLDRSTSKFDPYNPTALMNELLFKNANVRDLPTNFGAVKSNLG